jgi:twitching motility protein PilI
LSLADLSDRPFELLAELERRARASLVGRQGVADETNERVGVGFRLAGENFVAPREEVREVLPVPDNLTRVPGAKPWLKGIANVRGHLLPVVDLKAFLRGGITLPDRRTRIVVASERDTPSGLLVDEVVGFRRFAPQDYAQHSTATIIRCENYLDGSYQRGDEKWPLFRLTKLLEDEQFLSAAE